MDKNTRIIVNLFNYENFTVCQLEEVDKSIDRAREFYQNDVETYEHHLIHYPNMADHWQKQLDICKNILKAGFKAVTCEEYEKLMREKWLSKEPTEITEEEYNYALNVLPPKNWIRNERYSMFFIGECTTMTFYGQYLYDKVSGKYYTALTDIYDETTWLDKMLNL
jgi:hypothetical protein